MTILAIIILTYFLVSLVLVLVTETAAIMEKVVAFPLTQLINNVPFSCKDYDGVGVSSFKSFHNSIGKYISLIPNSVLHSSKRLKLESVY